MHFQWSEAIEILKTTPKTLDTFLGGLSQGWLHCNEGEGTWNVSEVVDHLIEAEKNNWIPRLDCFFKEGEERSFPPFDRFSHLKKHPTSIEQKLIDFKVIRSENIRKLNEIVNPDTDLKRTGIHPEFGVVSLSELISTWVVHDFTHLSQITRVMAKRYQEDVGPWKNYLGILNKK